MTKEDIKNKQATAALKLAELNVTLSELFELVRNAHRAVQNADVEALGVACNRLDCYLDSTIDGIVESAILSLNAYEEVAGKEQTCLI